MTFGSNQTNVTISIDGIELNSIGQVILTSGPTSPSFQTTFFPRSYAQSQRERFALPYLEELIAVCSEEELSTLSENLSELLLSWAQFKGLFRLEDE